MTSSARGESDKHESAQQTPNVEPLRKGALHRWHRDRGAVFGRWGDSSAVLNYGDVDAEARALETGLGILDRSAFSRLELLGEDRARFLNGLTTIDIPKLGVGDGSYGYLTAVKGGILSDLTVYALKDRLWLDLGPGRETAVREHLEKYIVADRVEVVALDEMVPLAILGAAFDRSVVASELGLAEMGGDDSHRRMKLWGSEVHVTNSRRLGLPGVVVWVSASIADLFAEDLLSHLTGSNGGPPRLVGLDAWQRFRIRSGLPIWGIDFDDKTLPQELDSLLGLDFEKGCYLGQEVIARLHYRGQVPRQLRRLRGDAQEPPGAGSEISLDGRTVGVLTSVTGVGGGFVGLARLARRAFEPGTTVEIAGAGVATVED